jgi:GTP-binding protein
VQLISAVTGEGISTLVHAVADAVGRVERESPEGEGFVLHRPLPPSFSVRSKGDEWLVEGRAAQRAVNLDDLTVPEAADLAALRLRRLGVDEALEAAGAEPGDDVRIGDLVFTYDPDLFEADEESERDAEGGEKSGSDQ